MRTPRIVILTSDVSLWALRPCAYLVSQYWPNQDVLVGGYSKPQFDLPDGWEFVSLGNFADYPVGRWSDGLIKFLNMIDDELITWVMDDFWMCRNVNAVAVALLADYMRYRPEVARVDLTTDRLYAANSGDVGSWNYLDLVASHLPVSYHFSWQAGIWRRSELLKYLQPNETPWTTEWAGTARMNDAKAVVIGTRQIPVKYLIAVQNSKLCLDGGYQVPAPVIPKEHLDVIRQWIPDSMLRPAE